MHIMHFTNFGFSLPNGSLWKMKKRLLSWPR
nr:MAG TPA: hypothetical protein [Caudoviricetes sp.]